MIIRSYTNFCGTKFLHNRILEFNYITIGRFIIMYFHKQHRIYKNLMSQVLDYTVCIYHCACHCALVFNSYAIISLSLTLLTYCTYTGDTGLRGPVGETGIKGAKGDQGNNLKFHKTRVIS